MTCPHLKLIRRALRQPILNSYISVWRVTTYTCQLNIIYVKKMVEVLSYFPTSVATWYLTPGESKTIQISSRYAYVRWCYGGPCQNMKLLDICVSLLWMNEPSALTLKWSRGSLWTLKSVFARQRENAEYPGASVSWLLQAHNPRIFFGCV